MTASTFDTHNETFRQLMGNGRMYVVPRFQRDYSWDIEQWEELWADLEAMMAPGGDAAHYMGYVVLRSAGGKTTEVIDGQQRLTTLSILVLAAMKNLEQVARPETAEATAQRVRRIRESYIGAQDPVTLLIQPKLTLNRNNRDYFENHLATLGPLPRRNIKATNALLRKAFDWFEARLSTWSRNAPDRGQELARFVEEMADRVFFTVIVVTDQVNAYRVFETLNARGLKLSPTDLLKNYLFATLSTPQENEVELTALQVRWESLISRLGDDDFSHFVRVHWNSRRRFVRQAELFRSIRAEIRKRDDVFALLSGLEEDLDAYLDLTEPEGAQGPSAEVREGARLLKLFQVKQPLSMLLAARRTLADADFAGLLRAVVTLSFRYNVICGLSPGEQEDVYADIARRLVAKELADLGSVVRALRPVYPGDDLFRESFAEKAMSSGQGRNSRIVKYILGQLELRLAGAPVDVMSDRVTVEHILPRGGDVPWAGFTEQQWDHGVGRLGNLTLMSVSRNRELGDAEYAVKRAEYEKSEFAITRKVAEDHAVWTPESIAARQRWMAGLATGHWRIAQLH